MAVDKSTSSKEEASTVKTLGKSTGVGLALGIAGLILFVIVTFLTGMLWAPIGLIPAVAAGYGVRRVAGERAGVLSGLIAVVTGQGPVALLYYFLMGAAYSVGKADVAVLMFGPLIAYKIGNGPDEESDSGDATDETPAGEHLDPDDIDSEAVAEALDGDDARPTGGDGASSN